MSFFYPLSSIWSQSGLTPTGLTLEIYSLIWYPPIVPSILFFFWNPSFHFILLILSHSALFLFIVVFNHLLTFFYFLSLKSCLISTSVTSSPLQSPFSSPILTSLSPSLLKGCNKIPLSNEFTLPPPHTHYDCNVKAWMMFHMTARTIHYLTLCLLLCKMKHENLLLILF